MKITNLCKSFGDNYLFKNSNFEFENKKITYLMGKSGVGKTTLLRILAGLDKNYTGEISDNKKVAYVFQEPRLFPSLNVLENIKIVSDKEYISPKTLLSIVELDNCEAMYPEELSGGMKMRLSIARALYHNADIVLMDEPFASIDDGMKERIAPKIFDLLKHKTVLVVSHDLEEAKKYADTIITI